MDSQVVERAEQKISPKPEEWPWRGWESKKVIASIIGIYFLLGFLFVGAIVLFFNHPS